MYHCQRFILLLAIVMLLPGTLADPTATRPVLPASASALSRASSTVISVGTPHITIAQQPRPSSIHGRVVLQGHSEHAPFSVLALRGGAIVGRARIGPRGEYLLREMAPGSYTLSVVDRQQRPLAPATGTPVQLAPGQ